MFFHLRSDVHHVDHEEELLHQDQQLEQRQNKTANSTNVEDSSSVKPTTKPKDLRGLTFYCMKYLLYTALFLYIFFN
jgi:hypothetical protein